MSHSLAAVISLWLLSTAATETLPAEPMQGEINLCQLYSDLELCKLASVLPEAMDEVKKTSAPEGSALWKLQQLLPRAIGEMEYLLSMNVEEQNVLPSAMEKRKSAFVRFGKRKSAFVRFGKRKSAFVRFGKRKSAFVRLGRSAADDAKHKSSYIRFG